MSTKSKIGLFLEGPDRNQWLYFRNMSVYLCKSNRMLGGQVRCVIDIANVTVSEDHQGQGVFKKFLLALTEEANIRMFNGLYVENVLTTHFSQYFERQGWSCTTPQIDPLNPPCYYTVF
jgi:GNAT superfamily N-acetyltransferase